MANQIQNKLLAYEVAPRAEVWEKIANTLDEEVEHSFPERLQQFESEPAGENWFKISTRLDEVKTKQGFLKKYHNWFVYSGAAAAIIIIAVLITLFSPKKTISNEVTANKIHQQIPSAPAPVYTKNALPDSTVTASQSIVTKSYDTGRYVTVTNGDGEKVRLSKKVLPVYTCATNEINARCRERIARLQRKMSATLASPSVDFGGILELVQNLKEDQ